MPTMTAQIRLRQESLRKIRAWTGLKTDASLATRMDIDPGNLSRVIRGLQQPGPKFIAALCTALKADFDDLFEIVPGGEEVA